MAEGPRIRAGTEAPITSTANARIKAAAALRRGKYRERADRYLVDGPRAVAVAARDGVVVEVFRDVDADVAVPASAGDVTTLVAPHVLARLTDARHPQGVVAVARRRRAALAAVVGRGVLVVADRVADPGNAGTLIRTADAFGASGVVLTRGSVDPWNPKAVRAAAGSLSHVDVVVGVDLAAVVDACRAAGQRTVGLDAAADVDLEDPGVLAPVRGAKGPPSGGAPPPVALVLGSEAHGLDPADAARLDAVASIAAPGGAESLNVAAAAAVATYVATRRDRAAEA